MKKNKKSIQRVINCLKNNRADIDRAIDIVQSVTLNVPLLIKFKGNQLKGHGWEDKVIEVAVKPITFNEGSLRCDMIAVEDANVYPFRSEDVKEPTTKIPLKYADILEWKKLEAEDLPLLAGFNKIYSLYEKLIKDAEYPEYPDIIKDEDKSFLKTGGIQSVTIEV